MRKLWSKRYFPGESKIVNSDGTVNVVYGLEEYLPGRFSFIINQRMYTQNGNYIRSIVHKGKIVFRNAENIESALISSSSPSNLHQKSAM